MTSNVELFQYGKLIFIKVLLIYNHGCPHTKKTNSTWTSYHILNASELNLKAKLKCCGLKHKSLYDQDTKRFLR
jgi:hypothetical protein